MTTKLMMTMMGMMVMIGPVGADEIPEEGQICRTLNVDPSLMMVDCEVDGIVWSCIEAFLGNNDPIALAGCIAEYGRYACVTFTDHSRQWMTDPLSIATTAFPVNPLQYTAIFWIGPNPGVRDPGIPGVEVAAETPGLAGTWVVTIAGRAAAPCFYL